MKIAVDATVVRAPLSGVHYAVRHACEALLDAAREDQVIPLATDPVILAAAASHGAAAPVLPGTLQQVWRRLCWQQSTLPGLLRHLEADWLIAMAYTAPLLTRTPTLLLVHDTIALRRPDLCSWLNGMHMRSLMPRSMRQANQIVVSSSSVREEVLELTKVPIDRVHIVPMGLDPLFLREPPKPLPPAIAALDRYLLFVGTLEPKKGLDTLLNAYRQVAREHADTALVLVGRTGWKCGELEREIGNWSGPGRIIRLGYVERELLPALYAGAAAHVMPSTEEGFGLPVLEAMACGTPVVHSDHPVLVETAARHGLAFIMGDPDDLARVLDRLLDNPDDYRTAAALAADYARHCTWERWAAQILDICHSGG